ncbi:MAG: uracil phosphoribosyltransferase [Gemmataceae bacterium]|nr:uracil phosphoribosyltransferase [Gemmata sp.]MDW8196870.1 uracil phosphoribosyltransferase [Gemmataceae bacterium]
MPAPVAIATHPLIQHQLARLRAAETRPPEFRALVAAIARGLFFEATRELRLEPLSVRTPLAETTGQRIAERLGLVPVLRAGLGMAEAMLEMMPEAVVWHLGLYRDHTTLKPVTYYNKLPPQPPMDVALVLDPMLATGGSAVAAIDILKKAGTPRIIFVGLIAAPEGVAALQAAHPEVPIVLAALDSHLNDRGYIVPGLGDAGDRQFGTA